MKVEEKGQDELEFLISDCNLRERIRKVGWNKKRKK